MHSASQTAGYLALLALFTLHGTLSDRPIAAINSLIEATPESATLKATRLAEGAIVFTSLWNRGPYANNYDGQCQPQEEHKRKWHEYKAFHEQCRRDTQCMRKALVWQCVDSDFCGGLGDNLHGLTFALYAAIASKRPFFISWRRLGVDLLSHFSQDGINVTLPDGFDRGCTGQIHAIDNIAYNAPFIIHGVSSRPDCLKIVTNMPSKWLFEAPQREILARWLPWMTHIKPFNAIGCAMRFLFKPSVLTIGTRQGFAHELPEKFSVIHYRVEDEHIGNTEGGALDRDYKEGVHEALQCAKDAGIHELVFVSGSGGVKDLAVKEGTDMGLQVFTANGEARHVDHDHSKLNPSQFESALWSDFLVMQQAESLIIAGVRNSGFSTGAASMGFMPEDKILYSAKGLYHDAFGFPGTTCEEQLRTQVRRHMPIST